MQEQRFTLTVESWGDGGVPTDSTITNAVFRLIQDAVTYGPIPATWSPSGPHKYHQLSYNLPAPLPYPVMPGVSTVQWDWTDDFGSHTETVAATVLDPQMIEENTAPVFVPTGVAPYDSPADGAYCSVKDVFSQGFGIPWDTLQSYIAKYQANVAMMFGDVTNLVDLISKHWIPEAESTADTYCRQTYKPTVVSMAFDGNDDHVMMLPFTPIYEMVSAEIFAIPSTPFAQFRFPRFVAGLGEINTDTQYADADLLIVPDTGEVYIPPRVLYSAMLLPMWNYQWIYGSKNCVFTWKYGFQNFNAVPRDFRHAVAKIVCVRALEALGIIEGMGMASYRTENVQRVWGREKDLPYGDLILRLETQWQATLKNWITVK